MLILGSRAGSALCRLANLQPQLRLTTILRPLITLRQRPLGVHWTQLITSQRLQPSLPVEHHCPILHTNRWIKLRFAIQINRRSVILRRCLHSNGPKKFINPSNFGQRPPRLRTFKISPLLVFLTGLTLFVLLLSVVPFMFTTFFPLIILAIAVHQFKKWRRNNLYGQLFKSLRNSSIHAKMGTINFLHVANMERMMKMDGINNDLLKDIFKNIKSPLGDLSVEAIHESQQDAKRLKQFVKNRVLEAIETDESGIRTFFLGNDVKKWVEEDYDLIIDTNFQSSFARTYQRHPIVQIKFPLYLKSSKKPKRHLANVVVAALPAEDRNASTVNSFQFLMNMPSSETECRLVIAVQSVGVLASKQFLITMPGKSGEWQSKYDTTSTSDGHTEYTIRNKNID